MTDDPLALLDAAAAVLRATAPGLPSEGRYAALLAANAVATARRDLALAAQSAAARAAIAAEPAAIRAGRHDDDAALHARLCAHAAIRAWIADPTSVSADERAAWIGEAAR